MSTVNFKPVRNFYSIAGKIFQEQKKIILEIIPKADVQHIGSTIIPKSITKGDLDINVRVLQKDFLKACDKLATLYKIDPNNKRIDTKASFIFEKQKLPVGIQLTVIGSRYDNFVKQRNLLLGNENLVIEYNMLKSKFEGKSMSEYRKKKSDFFEKLKLMKPTPYKDINEILEKIKTNRSRGAKRDTLIGLLIQYQTGML